MQFKNNLAKQSIQNDAFVGTLFLPKGNEQCPAVIILPGSEGGIPETIAEKVASQGYCALALGYFGLKGLPEYLEYIPLEYFLQTFESVKNLPQIKKDSLILLGYSRGGELALLLGSLFPQAINGIISFVSSGFICGGFPHPNKPAWIVNNQPIVPFLHGAMSKNDTLIEAEDLFLASEKGLITAHKNTADDPYEVVELFLARQKGDEIMRKAMIPVENISCPILVIAGEDDKIWPSALYAKLIMDRLNQKGSAIERKFLIFPNAGHGIIAPYEGPIYHPIGKFWCTLGGTPEGNHEANMRAWEETFKFLNRFS